MVSLAREDGGLILAIGGSEDEQPREAALRGMARLAHELGDGEALEPARALDALAVLDRRRDDDRKHEPGSQLVRRKRPPPDRVVGQAASYQRRLGHSRMLAAHVPFAVGWAPE